MRQKSLVGKQVAGRFTIKRFLGEGGMATVYVAEQAAEPREVALKIMNQELTNDRTFVRRFEREAKASARVKHPCSVQIVDYGVAEGLSYIAMELLVGDDLYVLLERQGSLPQARAVRILIDVCDALAVAHELGIVHRDLKPENIMVIADPAHPSGERVKVLDFGIAKILAADAIAAEQSDGGDPRLDPASAVTRAGTFIGTPAYMSPEQCALLPVDTRADIYTCGVLLFQLVTGRLPFEGQTPLHTSVLHIHEPPPAPSSFAPAVDPRLDALILKALSKRPAERHQTARHLGASLRKLLPEIPETRVGLATGGARGAGTSQRPIAVTIDAPPSSAARRASIVGAVASVNAPLGEGRAPDGEVPDSSDDDPRTLVRVSSEDLAAPLGSFTARVEAPTFGPPARGDARYTPFARTEKSIGSDVIPHARGHAAAVVSVVAPAPFVAPVAAPPPGPAPFARQPPRAAASPVSGARGLLFGLAIGLAIVGVMVAAYVLLLRG